MTINLKHNQKQKYFFELVCILICFFFTKEILTFKTIPSIFIDYFSQDKIILSYNLMFYEEPSVINHVHFLKRDSKGGYQNFHFAFNCSMNIISKLTYY